MGLDIYLYKVTKDGEETHNCEGENKKNFEKYFSHALIDMEVEYINFVETFRQKDLDYENYEWAMSSSSGFLFKPVNKESGTEDLLIKHDELVTFIENEKAVRTTEVGYQRKGMEQGFASAIPDVDTEDGTLTVFKKEDVLKLYEFVTESNKPSFKENIVDRFVEGENFLWFWW